ncbi:hypothetical protein [Halobacteriovorax sp. JY17]|uniref:hypothetical protein n=1 Tax=Halobacteriovorax sp. JY17 TaxID=2014617 RepID=UPI000C484189|nr:hypothetical protein [Halobacteriovorax sp. JY17]PIK15022.1 MAG: hypothetical protein CES88_11860 [Halobacteriovorax sp. JY17]
MKILLIAFILLALTSCGKSPLFNHENEKDQITQGTNAVASSLSFKSLNLYLKINWLKGPYGDPSLENSFMIIVQDSNGELTDLPSQYAFYNWGWMPSMGHGTADDGYTERLSKGVYIQRELYFNMGGDWDLNIQLYEGSNLSDSTKVELSL